MRVQTLFSYLLSSKYDLKTLSTFHIVLDSYSCVSNDKFVWIINVILQSIMWFIFQFTSGFTFGEHIWEKQSCKKSNPWHLHQSPSHQIASIADLLLATLLCDLKVSLLKDCSCSNIFLFCAWDRLVVMKVVRKWKSSFCLFCTTVSSE